MKKKSVIGARLLLIAILITVIMISAIIFTQSTALKTPSQVVTKLQDLPTLINKSRIPTKGDHSDSLTAAANATTQTGLAAAAALGEAEAKAAAREAAPEVNQYGVTKAEVAAARAESLKWMAKHCDAERNICKFN